MGVAVSIDADFERKPSLDALTALVRDDLIAVNSLILDRMQSPVPLIPQLAGHVVAAGGKRLWPRRGCAAIAAGAILVSPPASSSSTPRHCCTTMSLTIRRCAGDWLQQTLSGATSRAFWWATFYSAAPSS